MAALRSLPVLLLALVGCGGGSLDQGTFKVPDTGASSGGDGEDGADGDDGGDEGEDGGDEGSDGGDEGSDGGDEGTDGGDEGSDDGSDGGPTACENMWDPVHVPGWSKSFAVTYQGGTGTGTMTSLGPIPDHAMSASGDVYGVLENVTTSSGGYDLTFSIGCDTDGEGLFVHDYDGDFETILFEILPITGGYSSNLSPGRQYLPPEDWVGTVGAWNYSYVSTMTVSMADPTTGTETPQTSPVTFTGTMQEAGFTEIVLATGETVEAYKIINSFTSSGFPPFGVTVPAEGYFETWYVKGLGLVKEASYDNANPSVPLLTKELASYSGLTVITD